MPLSASRLGGAIRQALVGEEWTVDGPELTTLCDVIAQAVVDEVNANAQVDISPAGGVTVTSPPGVNGGPCVIAGLGRVL